MKKAGFNPRTLFAASEPGAWYDPSDMSTLFQDSAGTVPVTAVEQPVGRILDKSGRGNHATQATTTKRPVLKIDAGGCYYLSFDGVDDALQTGNIDFTGTDKMTVWAGVTPLLAGGSQYIAATNTGTGRFALMADHYGATQFESRGLSSGYAQSAPLMSGQVLCGRGDISGDVSVLRRNGVQVASATTDQGAGNYGNSPLIIGGFTISTSHFNGRLYSLIVRGAQSSLSQIEATEAYIKQKMRLP